VGVLNNKQGFTDSDRFHKLEKWLETVFGSYWDEKFDQFKVVSDNLNFCKVLYLICVVYFFTQDF
jgi:hypothetical protein